MERIAFGHQKYFCLGAVALAVITSCAEPPRAKSPAHAASNAPASQGELASRARVNPASANFTQVFGGGYVNSSATGTGATAPTAGFIGNTGGFGFSGSIASVLGNVGGLGLGGFGAFANFFAGTLPNAAPGGTLPTPGTGTTPPAFFGGGGFGAPATGAPTTGTPATGGATGGGGFGGGTFTGGGGFGGFGTAPPTTGTIPPFTGGTATPVPALAFGAANFGTSLAGGNTSNVTLVDVNLNEFTNPLASNVDLVFVASGVGDKSSKSIGALAITETVTPCRGGGTTTRTVNDVDPVGFSTGDSRATLFTDCIQRTGGTAVINGTRSFTADLVSGVPFVDPVFAVKTTMANNIERVDAANASSFAENGTSTTNIDSTATATIHASSGQGSIVRTEATSSTNVAYNFSMDFTLDKTAHTYTMQMDLSVDTTGVTNSGIAVTTPITFEGTHGQSPTAGQLRVSKFTNSVMASMVMMTAQADGTVLVETDSNGDGVIDTTVTQPNWFGVIGQIFWTPI